MLAMKFSQGAQSYILIFLHGGGAQRIMDATSNPGILKLPSTLLKNQMKSMLK